MDEIDGDAEQVHEQAANDVAVRYHRDVAGVVAVAQIEEGPERTHLHFDQQLAVGRRGERARGIVAAPARIAVDGRERRSRPAAEIDLVESGRNGHVEAMIAGEWIRG